jgi:hypothetical protein
VLRGEESRHGLEDLGSASLGSKLELSPRHVDARGRLARRALTADRHLGDRLFDRRRFLVWRLLRWSALVGVDQSGNER